VLFLSLILLVERIFKRLHQDWACEKTVTVHRFPGSSEEVGLTSRFTGTGLPPRDLAGDAPPERSHITGTRLKVGLRRFSLPFRDSNRSFHKPIARLRVSERVEDF
jgi:hypothetical protein